MITKIEIKDNNNLSKCYARDIEALSNGKVYEFRKGVNIIVGKNGCGKSTLLKLISDMCLCSDSASSEVPDKMYKYPDIFNEQVLDNEFTLKDGIDIHCDYTYKVFNYKSDYEKSDDEKLSNVREMSFHMLNNASSTGEKTLNNINLIFDSIFNCKPKDLVYPIESIKKTLKGSSEMAKKNKLLLDYYKRNHIPVTKDNYSVTILMDEPDRNLDVDNIDTIFNILNHNKKDIQIICIIHNPILIYKLSKSGNANFIEMTDGYIESIKNIIENV